MASAHETFTKFMGKKDRGIANVPKQDLTHISLAPKTASQQLLKNISADINDMTRERGSLEIPVSDAFGWFINARSLRHDNMCDMITGCAVDQSYLIGDVLFSDFCVKNCICKKEDIPETVVNKTPDILIINRDTSIIYLGDVAVTNSLQVTIQRKHEKYNPLINFLRSKGRVVTHVDCIFKSDRSNLNQIIQELLGLGLIRNDQATIELHAAYFEVANMIMHSCRTLNSDPCEFNRMLDATDMCAPSKMTLPNVPKEILDGLPELYSPTLSENAIIEMIKNKVDTYNVNEYFNSSIDSSIQALDNIISENKKKAHAAPKSTLQVVYNTADLEEHTDLQLLDDYLDDTALSDSPVAEYMKYILPNRCQVTQMKRFKNKEKLPDVRTDKDLKDYEVYGPYQYKISSSTSNYQISDFNYRMSKGKKNKNVKEEPKCIDLSFIDNYTRDVDSTMSYLGSQSKKPSMFNDDWDSKTQFELENTKKERDAMRYSKSTNGAQLSHSMSMLYDRLTHLTIKQSQVDNVFVPPNGAFICIIPKQHAPLTAKNVDIPMVFIARCHIGKVLSHIEYEYEFEGNNYRYYISKPCRLNIDRLSNWTNASCKLVASSSYILSRCDGLMQDKHMLIGMLTVLIIDSHQKVSEFTDLLKYISYMPFSQVHKMPDLIKDKMDLLIKTKLDAWMISKLKDFIIELADLSNLKAKKPKLRTFNTTVMPDSLGLDATLPSFISPKIRHTKPADFIEEMNIIHCCRAKHLYGSQFMDKSITQTVDWNIEYEREISEYGSWATTGCGEGVFPFDSKFCFSSDAIFYANLELNKKMGIVPGKVEGRLHNSGYSRYMHENCTLRGCTKNEQDRSNQSDIHTTSLDACLKYYKEVDYNEEKSTSNYIAYKSLSNNEQQQYSMSEKDQRGGGRPIATPMLTTKAVLMMIEKPEQARGAFMTNNIIVPNVNKAQHQCEAYKRAISEGVRLGYRKIYQLTEDQTKFSENDNVNKYLTYIRCNPDVDVSIRAVQYAAVKQMTNRVHVVKRLPRDIKESADRLPYVINTPTTLGVKAKIGWPQGMLNCISTNVHAGADVWITKAYNIAYPENKVHTVGLVHSDDSWVTVCCNTEDDFKKFALFRIIAKKMFCLKLNTKKLWGSGMLGELVSNYNLNGNVHLSVAKIVPNSFGNLNYQNWVMDVHNQVSVLQQCYRNGATLGTIIMLATILRQQITRCYQVKGKQAELLYDLPVDIGGYPDASPFELAVVGLPSSYKNILDKMKRAPNSDPSKIVRMCLHWSIERIITEEQILVESYGNTKRKTFYENLKKDKSDSWADDDFENLVIPSKGDIFRCIRHIMPKSRKLAKTVKTIRELPFETNGLELIVSRPKSLQEALGHLKARASSMVYELAADKYTQNAKRLAISQSIQSSGRVIKVGGLRSMSFNDFYNIALNSNDVKLSSTLLSDAFDENNELVSCTYNVVHQSNQMKTDDDKRQVLSKMPIIDTKFKTIAPIRDVLLRIIDKHTGSNNVEKYSKISVAFETLDNDANIIFKRFISYFNCHDIIPTCNLIIQQFMSTTKSKLWTQPHLRNESLLVFCEDLYGKTVNSKYNFSIVSSINASQSSTTDTHIVQTIYNTTILNNLYPNKFKMLAYDNRTLQDTIADIDYRNFSDNDLCKYAVIQALINKNTDFLHSLYSSNVYRQAYMVPQRYNHITKTYVGFFRCICMMGQTVVEISGEPGMTMSIVSNTTSIMSILNVMKTFIDRNFKYEQYSNPTIWGQRAFWTNRDVSNGPFLNYYNQYSTIISNSSAYQCIPIKIEQNLRFPGHVDNYSPTRFEISETLKEIYYIDEKGNKKRFANIQQNFSLPHRHHVVIDPAPIQGIDNTELYSSGVIESLVMDNTTYVNSSIIETLLSKSIYGQLNSRCLVMTFLKFMCKALKIYLDMPEEEALVDVEVAAIDIEGETPFEITNKYEETEPEDLSAVFVEFTLSSNERVGRLHIINNFHKALAKAYIGSISDYDRDSFIKYLLVDKDIRRWFIALRDNDSEEMSIETIKNDIEDISPCPIDFRLYAFLIVTGINTNATWSTIDLKKIDKAINSETIDQKIKVTARSFIEHVATNIFEEEYVAPVERSILDI
uniref:RNA-directed RNA polymerase L n=1 Tax=Peralta bunya-like virus TaxID=2716674 RepID=A0A6G7PSL6_9VIRU|nr:RNA-dependent RNA polymerase [Peralta bunya-like virus]